MLRALSTFAQVAAAGLFVAVVIAMHFACAGKDVER